MLHTVYKAWQPIARLGSSLAAKSSVAMLAQPEAPPALLFSSGNQRKLNWTGLAASACATGCWIVLVDYATAKDGEAKTGFPRALTYAQADALPYSSADAVQYSRGVTVIPGGAVANSQLERPTDGPNNPTKVQLSADNTADQKAPELGTCGPSVPVDIAKLKAYEGYWLVSFRNPGSMERFFDLFRVSPLIQWVARHVPGYQLQVDEQSGVLRLSILSPVPFIKLTETYRLDGKEVTNRRRDFRWGAQSGRLELCEGCLRLHLRWGEPLRGRATDVFRLTSPDTMVLSSEATLDEPPPIAPGAAAAAGEGGGASAVFRCLCRRDPPVGP